MKFCPYCEESLQIVDVDHDGFDIYGCVECAWNELNNDIDKDMEFYI